MSEEIIYKWLNERLREIDRTLQKLTFDQTNLTISLGARKFVVDQLRLIEEKRRGLNDETR